MIILFYILFRSTFGRDILDHMPDHASASKRIQLTWDLENV